MDKKQPNKTIKFSYDDIEKNDKYDTKVSLENIYDKIARDMKIKGLAGMCYQCIFTQIHTQNNMSKCIYFWILKPIMKGPNNFYIYIVYHFDYVYHIKSNHWYNSRRGRL